MKSIFSFYQKIYEQELSQAKTLHLHSSRVLKRYFVSKKEEILNDEHPYVPVSDKQGEEIIKTLELKSNEVNLKYYTFARVSRFVSLNKYESTRVYPLFSFDAAIEIKDGNYYLNIDRDSKKFLKNNVPRKIVASTSFKKIQPLALLDFHFASQLNRIIKKTTPKADVDELLFYPNLWSNKEINKELKAPFEVGEKYIPIGVLAIVEKENNSFTTLNELNQLSKTNDVSAPLATLFDNSENVSEEKMGIICEELNASQYHAIENSNSKIVSVVSGPPGTGKSFTIANLAAEKVSKGKSILITSKNKEALDVIEEKIKENLGIHNLCVNPSKDQNFSWMKEHLNFVLGRQYKKKNIPFRKIESAFSSFQRSHDKHLVLEKELMEQFRKERDYAASLDRGFTKKTSTEFRRRIFSYRGQTSIPLWESLNAYYHKIESIRKQAIDTLHLVNSFMLEDSINKFRKELRQYLAFLRARDHARKTKLSKEINYQAVLKAFPVWLVRANDVSRVLPLEKEAFDVLIIDEASQCDIPSMIPLMQRAKKVIIVGDTKQLTHISFISKVFERACKSEVPVDLKHLCQHRDRSILHLAEDLLDPQDSIQLNEHFRSQFPIIAFSNDHFYQNRLDILTKRPISVSAHVQFIKQNGQRVSGRNEEEGMAIIERIKALISKEHDLPDALKTSIGILSPFRKQVDYLFDTVIETFTLGEIKKHKIIVGTAFTFQGNERDIMLLSLSLDDKAQGGSFTFLNRKDVFNVSITRARNQQFIYHSFDHNQLKTDTTIAHFFRFYSQDLQDDLGKETRDTFCIDVAEILAEKGFKTWTNFDVSGVSIDLLTQVDDQFIGIDLIGFPGEMEDYYSLERYKMIERGKIKLFPLSYPLWMGDREKCLAAIMQLITPIEVSEPVEKIELEQEESPILEKDKKSKRTYTRFDINKIKLTYKSTEQNDYLAVQLRIGNTTYGKLYIDVYDIGGFFELYVIFDVVKRHRYKGLEEKLFHEVDKWILNRPSYSKIYVNLYGNFGKEVEILKSLGYFQDFNKTKLQKQPQSNFKQIRMVKFFNYD